MYLDVFHCATNLFLSLGINGSADDWSAHGQSANSIYMHAYAYMYAYTHICTHAHTRIHTHVYRCTQRYAWTVFFFSIHISSVWPHLIRHDINYIKLKCTVLCTDCLWSLLNFPFSSTVWYFPEELRLAITKKRRLCLCGNFSRPVFTDCACGGW